MIGAELVNYARRVIADWRGRPEAVAEALDELAARTKAINVYDNVGGQAFRAALPATLDFKVLRYNTQPAVFRHQAGGVYIDKPGFYLVQFYVCASSGAAKRKPWAQLLLAAVDVQAAAWQATTSGVTGDLVAGGAAAVVEVTAALVPAKLDIELRLDTSGNTPTTVADRSGLVVIGPLA